MRDRQAARRACTRSRAFIQAQSGTHQGMSGPPEPAEEVSIAGLLLMVLFIGTLTMGIALVGHRRWQHGIAVDLLVGRGLSAPEAKAHIAQVVDSRKVPLFAPATVLAGLEVGDVTPTAVKEEEAKAAELESIYGGNQAVQTSSAFAPPTASPAFSAGSQAAAADALALLNDETPIQQPLSLIHI